MGTAAIAKGLIFDDEGRRYQLLRKVEDDAWLAEDTRTGKIVERTVAYLQTMYATEKLRFFTEAVAAHQSAKPRPIDYSSELWDTAKVRRAYVKGTWDIPNTRSRLVPAIDEIWKKLAAPEFPPNAATVIRWKNKYRKAGGDLTSLIEQHDQKGNHTQRHSSDVRTFVTTAIDKVYLTLERGTIQDTVDNAQALVNRENRLRPDGIRLQLPTRRLVKRMIFDISEYDRYAARHGRVPAIKRFRSVLGHPMPEEPLDLAEIDHGVLDLLVIDDKNGMPFGRPFITACTDVASKNPLGIHIGFDPPSYYTVARCLRHAFLPKAGLRDEYPGIKNEWLAHGIMRELRSDNGPEFHAQSLENALYTLGCDQTYSPRKKPWFKPGIERFIGTTVREVTHVAPGTTFANIFEKGEYDPAAHAVIRYSVFREVLFRWFVDVYMQRPHRSLDKVPPAAFWVSRVSPDQIRLPEDPGHLDAILGASEVRTLTHKGIEIFCLFYNSPELTELRQKLGTKLEVEIRVDNGDIGKIIVISPDKRQFISVPCTTPGYAAGLSEFQHRICRRFAAGFNKFDSEGWLEAKLQIRELIEREVFDRKRKSRVRQARYRGDKDLLAKREDKSAASEETMNQPSSGNADVSDDLAGTDPISPEATFSLGSRKSFKPSYRERGVEATEKQSSSG